MKNQVFSLTAAAALILGAGVTSTALADDPFFQNRIAAHNAKPTPDRTESIAVYSENRGLGRRTTVVQERNAPTELHWMTNAHGQRFPVYAPADRTDD